MKLALAQVNARLGDLDGICARLEQQVFLAGEAGADLLCLPAPLFTGVVPGTLVDYPNFEHDLLHHLQQVATAISTSKVACLVPVVLPLEGGSLFEAMLLRHGNVIPLRLTMITHHEEMPVSPWSPPVIEVAGSRVAVTFDFFRDCTELPHGCDLAVYFSVQGFDVSNEETAAVASVNDGHFSSEVERAGLWMACMAPVGGFDDSVFTGGSFVMDDSGRVIAQAPCFEEHLLVQEIQRGVHVDALASHELPSYQKEIWLWEALRLYVRDAVDAAGTGRAVIPMTGDLQSGLLAALAVDALGSRNVFGLFVEHDDAQTPEAEALASASTECVREVASRLHIRLIERSAPDLSRLLDRDIPMAPSLRLRTQIDSLLLTDTAQEQRALPLIALTKTDYALLANAAALQRTRALAPFGDVYLTSLEWLARTRNQASAILPNDLVSLTSVEKSMSGLLCEAVERLELDEMFARRAEQVLCNAKPIDIDTALMEHVDDNRVLEDLSLFTTSPEAAALVLMLVRCNESGRRTLPSVPIVSKRSFAERLWPVSLAWSDLGRHGTDSLRAVDLAEAEYRRLEKRGEKRGQLARSEVMGMIGSLLGLSPEQQSELMSDEGQQRIRDELQEFEGNMREMLRRMAEQGEGSSMGPGRESGGLPPMGMSPAGFNFFSLN